MIDHKDIRKGIYLKDKSSDRIGRVKYIRGNIISCEMEFSTLTQHIDEWDYIEIKEDILKRFGFAEVYRSSYRVKYDLVNNLFCGYDFNLQNVDNGMDGFRYYGRYIDIDNFQKLQNLCYILTKQDLILQ